MDINLSAPVFAIIYEAGQFPGWLHVRKKFGSKVFVLPIEGVDVFSPQRTVEAYGDQCQVLQP